MNKYYIARDENNHLYLYDEPPYKRNFLER